MTASPTDPAAMPSEEALARLLMKQFYEQWYAPGKAAHNGSVYWDFVNGESAWTQQARAVLALFAPILAEKEAIIRAERFNTENMRKLAAKQKAAGKEYYERALAAEAALAAIKAKHAEWRKCMPADWEGDQLSDAIEAAAIRTEGE